MNEDPVYLHDTSRIDSFMAARRRAMVLHAVWRPMLAGAVGAALVVAAVWAASPKLHFNVIEVPRVTLKDVIVPNVIQKDVTVDHVVPHDVPVDRLVPPTPRPVAEAPKPPAPPEVSAPPATPAEKKFTQRPEYESADYKGRLVYDKDGFIRFDNDRFFFPPRQDPKTGKAIDDGGADSNVMYDTKSFLGDLAFCNKVPASKNQF
jgi:hypothetical protein